MLASMCDAATRTNGIERRIGHDEELITLTAATGHLPKVDGKKVSICTLWRWCRRGLRGVFLEYVRVGRKICTTRQALLRFFTDLAEIDERIEPVQQGGKGFRRTGVSQRPAQPVESGRKRLFGGGQRHDKNACKKALARCRESRYPRCWIKSVSRKEGVI
jgi:hypothetical protein